MIRQFTSSWWVFILQGILTIGIGVAAFAAPSPTLTAFLAVFAAYAIVSGILGVVAGLSMPSGPNWALTLGGVAGIAVGAITIASPDSTAVAVVLLVGIFAIATGVAQVGAALSFRRVTNTLLLGVSGVVSVAFGVLLLAAPGDGVLTVLWLIGFYALFAGAMYVAAGIALRRVDQRVSSLETQTTSTNSATSAS